MVFKNVFQKVFSVATAGILLFSTASITAFAEDAPAVTDPVTINSTTPPAEQVVVVESITVDQGQTAISVNDPNGSVTVNDDVTSSGYAFEYEDAFNNKYTKAYDAVVANSGKVAIGGDVNANGDEQAGVTAMGDATITVNGKIAAGDHGISATENASVTAGSVNAAGNAIQAFDGGNVQVNGDVYSTGKKSYNSEWDREKWVPKEEVTSGTAISSDGTGNIVIDGDVQGFSEGVNLHRGIEDQGKASGSLVITGKLSVASENGAAIGIGNSYGDTNQTETYATVDDVLASIPAIYVYEIDKPYIWVNRTPEDGSATSSEIQTKVITSINYIIKQDTALNAVITNPDDNTSNVGSITVNGTDYSTVNIGKAFKVAATLDEGYTLSGGDNVSVSDNGDGTFTLMLRSTKGGINIKAVLRPAPAPTPSGDSNNSSNGSGETYEVVVEEITPANEDPSKAPAGAIVISNNTGTADASPATAAISGDKPARTVSYSISNISPIQYKTSIIENVSAAPAGGALNIETDRVACFDSKMMEAIAARSDIDVNVVFTYGGKKLKVTIPAGYDVRSLLDANGYCGFLRLMAILGASEL